ncbi:MAG: DUF420 domain-containing protein [Nitrospirae bacterium]|nr:DUF420 domain-containing protein [Candidatus Troglogloeales bacterium]
MIAFLKSPGFLSPHGTMGADISSIMAWVFTLLFLYGWHLAKKHQGQRHHLLTLWGMIAMLGYFTSYYLARGLGARALEGKEGFGGPDWVYSYIFLPLLYIHILVISIGLVLAVYMLILGFRTYIKKEGEMHLRSAPLTMTGKSVRNILIVVGILFGGIAIVRWGPIERFLVYLFGFLLVAMMILVERGLEKWIPDGGQRHRKIGTFTMILYAIALVTSTSTYLMLYFIYPIKEVVGG